MKKYLKKLINYLQLIKKNHIDPIKIIIIFAEKMKKSKKEKDIQLIFSKKNYILMIIGLLLMGLGYVLMIGGGSADPNVFSEEIFSFRRITLAPILILLGIVVEIFVILLNFDKKV